MTERTADPVLIVADGLARYVRSAAPVRDQALLNPGYRRELTAAALANSCRLVDLMADLRKRLLNPPYYVVVRGLSFDPGNVLLATIASLLGEPLQPYPSERFTVLRELRPSAVSQAPGWGVLTEWLHTDSTNWHVPHDVTLMLCRHPDEGNHGISLVLPANDAVATLHESLGSSAVSRLRDTFLPWAIDPALGGGIVWEPALTDLGVRWQLFRVVTAAETEGVSLAPSLLAFLQLVDATLSQSACIQQYLLQEHELMLINNRMALHARGAILDPDSSERVLVHCKLNLRR